MLWSIHLLRICTYTSWCHTLYFFFLKDPPPTKISTLPLHDALPISKPRIHRWERRHAVSRVGELRKAGGRDALQRSRDRKSTRLNSSHGYISYAVFCLKKKKKNNTSIGIHSPTERSRLCTSLIWKSP